MEKFRHIASLYLRGALGFTLLSAVADRFGLWGATGEPNVVWGNWENFAAYTHTLNFFVPYSMAEILAVLATVAETGLGLLLLMGLFTRWVAIGTGVLILLFALTMAMALGIKAPLDYSVFVDSAAGFLLATIPYYRWSIDEWLLRKQKRSVLSNK